MSNVEKDTGLPRRRIGRAEYDETEVHESVRDEREIAAAKRAALVHEDELAPEEEPEP